MSVFGEASNLYSRGGSSTRGCSNGCSLRSVALCREHDLIDGTAPAR
jgi:hypothetical protein